MFQTIKHKSILDKNFKYVPSHETDIRKTFERIRKEQQPRKMSDAAEKDRQRLIRSVK